MDRRELLKSAAAFPFLASAAFASAALPAKKMIKPRRLKKGDTVALIAPSGPVDADRFEAALENVTSLGLVAKPGKFAQTKNGFLAGTDAERLADLHDAFADEDIDGIWCIRGGYGATRYLANLDLRSIRRNPKVFIGYSDITALHLAIHQRTGLVTFHGPGASSTFSDYTRESVVRTLMEPPESYTIGLSPDNIANENSVYKTETITKGTARGELIGGNLSLISAMSGTPFELRETKGKILFIEDVGEAPYRIDRMLTQLRQAHDLRKCAAIACGIFSGCERKDETSQSLIDVIRDRLGDIGIPVVYGLSFGHIRDQCTFPVGIKAELDADNATITITEPAVK